MFYRNRSTRALTSPIHPCTLVRCSPSGVWCGDGACVSEFPLTVSSAHMYFMCQPILGNLYNISVLCIFTVVQHFFRSPDYWDFFFIRSFCAIHHFLRITNAHTNAGIADTHTLTPFFFFRFDSSWSVWLNTLLEFFTFWWDSCLLCVSFSVSIFMPSPFKHQSCFDIEVWNGKAFLFHGGAVDMFSSRFCEYSICDGFLGGVKKRHINLKQKQKQQQQ